MRKIAGCNILLVENSGADFYSSRISYAKFLLECNFQVTVLIPDDGYTEQIRNSGLRVLTYSATKSKNWFLSIIYIFLGYKKILDSNDFDIVHSYRFFPNLLNVFFNSISTRKVVLHITGLGLFYSVKSFKFIILRYTSNVLYYLMLNLASKIIVQNQEDKRELSFSSSISTKIHVIEGSGVNTNLYCFNLDYRRKHRSNFGFSDKEIVFFCVTRLIWEKGIREMVQAFRELEKTLPFVKLVIVGEPDNKNLGSVSREFIARENYGNVNFLGRQSNVNEILSAADVFIFPSYYREGIPRCLLEALSTGLPIITSTMPGCDLTVRENENGFLIPPKSAEAIRNSVFQVVEFRKDFYKMSQVSRNLALTRFSEEVIFSQILKTYNIN